MNIDLTQIHALNYRSKRSAPTLPFLRFVVSECFDSVIEGVTQDCVGANVSKFVLGIIPPIVSTGSGGKLKIVCGGHFLASLFAFLAGDVEYPSDGAIEGLRGLKFGDLPSECKSIFMEVPIQMVNVHEDHKDRYLELVSSVQNKKIEGELCGFS